jgi:hypothetical protein
MRLPVSSTGFADNMCCTLIDILHYIISSAAVIERRRRRRWVSLTSLCILARFWQDAIDERGSSLLTN